MTSIYTLYQSHQKNPQVQSIYKSDTKSQASWKNKDQVFTNQMAKALAESRTQLANLRQNSPTFRQSDIIAHNNNDIQPFRPSIKKAMYSDIDNIKNPNQQGHKSTNLLINHQLQMYQENYRSKKQGECSNLKFCSSQKEWKPSIMKCVQTKKPESAPKRIRKSVNDLKQSRNPILEPDIQSTNRVIRLDNILVKLRKSGIKPTLQDEFRSPSKKTYKEANQSNNFKAQWDSEKMVKSQLIQQSPGMRQSAVASAYGLDAKKLLEYEYGPTFRDIPITEKCNSSKKKVKQEK